MNIKKLPSFKRPQEKLFTKGPESLRDDELVALLFRTGYRKKNAVQLAKDFLKADPLFSVDELIDVDTFYTKGVGKSKRAALIAGIELGKRVAQYNKMPSIKTPEDVVKVVSLFRNKKREHFIALYLNARYQLIDTRVISIGTIDASIAHPREVYEPAIRLNAASLIVAHNHPSGETEPSNADILLTRRLQEAGNILDIKLRDHIILTDQNYISLRQEELF